MKTNIIIISAFFYLTFTTTAIAQHNEHHHDDKKHDTEHHDDHHATKHHIALFNGATTNFDHSVTGYTLGIDYIYSFSKMFGVGAAAEYIFANDGEYVLGVPFTIQPYKGFIIVLSPIGINAAEHTEDDGSHKAGSTGETHREWHFGARASLGYSFHLSKLSVTPIISYDRVNTQALVYGVSFGMGF